MANGFGISQIKKQTPTWALWFFRITFIITTSAAAYFASTNLINDSVKYEIILILKFIDPIIFVVSKMFGVEQNVEQTNSAENETSN